MEIAGGQVLAAKSATVDQIVTNTGPAANEVTLEGRLNPVRSDSLQIAVCTNWQEHKTSIHVPWLTRWH